MLSGEGHTAGRGDYSGPTSLLTSRDLWGFTRKRTHHFSNNRAGRKKGKGPSRGTLNMTDASDAKVLATLFFYSGTVALCVKKKRKKKLNNPTTS